jgi:hypothetical protein
MSDAASLQEHVKSTSSPGRFVLLPKDLMTGRAKPCNFYLPDPSCGPDFPLEGVT